MRAVNKRGNPVRFRIFKYRIVTWPVLVLMLPVCIVIGVVKGFIEALKEWAYEFKI